MAIAIPLSTASSVNIFFRETKIFQAEISFFIQHLLQRLFIESTMPERDVRFLSIRDKG